MIEYEQAVYFLDVVLRMPPTWKQLAREDPLQFLTSYLKRHAIRVPFQNMEMAAVPPENRWFPTEAELVTQGLSGKGGCCLHLNYFTMMIFRTIGLDSFIVRGDHFGAPVAGTHCLVMVKLDGPKDFGTYMVETGGFYPILEVIPMDSEKLPYRTLQAGGFPYEYREIAPGWTDKREAFRTYWELKRRSLWEFDYPMLETFTNPAVATPLKFPLLYRFFSNSEFRKIFPNLSENFREAKGVQINNGIGDEDAADDLEDPQFFIYRYKRRMIVGDTNSRKIVKDYETYKEMAEDVKKYFRVIPTDAVDRAMEVFNEIKLVPSPFDSIL